jgi:hypothetical protein
MSESKLETVAFVIKDAKRDRPESAWHVVNLTDAGHYRRPSLVQIPLCDQATAGAIIATERAARRAAQEECEALKARIAQGDIKKLITSLQQDAARLDWCQRHATKLEEERDFDGSSIWVVTARLIGEGKTLREAIDASVKEMRQGDPT